MTHVLTWVGVAALGAVGAYARFAVGAWVTERRSGTFPAGTFVVNLTGAFALGLLTGFALDGVALLVVGTGLLGAYTTFSTWMVEAQRLGEDGDLAVMVSYLAWSMVAGVAVAGLGWAIGGAIA
jgi:fluoride exporter